MKKMKKVMMLLLAVSMVCMTGAASFADVQAANGNDSCLICTNAEEGHVHDESCYNHSWDNGQETTPATCTEDGKQMFTCTAFGCNATRTEPIASGHVWDAGEITTAPTCTEKGELKYTCIREGCEETRTEEIAEVPHTYDEGDTKTIEATCTTKGEITKACSVCQNVSVQDVAMKGHQFKDGICTDCGIEMRLEKGKVYKIYATDGVTTCKYRDYTAGSSSSLTLSFSNLIQTKAEIEGGKVKKLKFVGFSNDDGKTLFQTGDMILGSILDTMTPTENGEIYFKAVYEAVDGTDQTYDDSLSGKKVDRKTIYETSEGITLTVQITDKKRGQITVIIPKGYDKDVVSVDATEALMEAWSGTFMPGGAGRMVTIIIDNQSDKEFKYKNGSFIIQSPSFIPDGNTYDFENEIEGYLTGARTFDGETPYYTYGTIRTSNAALKALYNTEKTLTVEQLLDSRLGAVLKEHGYEKGIADLAEYYLDYINAMQGTSYTNMTQVPDSVLTSTGPFGGYVVNSYAKESNAEIAGAGYNYFYNPC